MLDRQITAPQGKPRKCSLKQDAVKRFSLKSDDTVFGTNTAQELFDEGDGATGGHDEVVHIRIQQRNGRKTLTTVQGINPKYDFKKIIRVCKKEFACNGTVVEHPEYGEVIQFQGDQRNHIKDFLLKVGLVKPEGIKVHGF